MNGDCKLGLKDALPDFVTDVLDSTVFALSQANLNKYVGYIKHFQSNS